MVELKPRLTSFTELAELCRALEGTTKRNQKIVLIGGLLKRLAPEEIAQATLFLSGKAFPEADPRVLDVSYATMAEAGRSLGQTRLTESPLTIGDRKSTRLNSSHLKLSRMPSSA